VWSAMTRPHVVTLGETMALFSSRDIGPLECQREFSLGIGGAESNVAIGLVRLGVSATWVGRVGDDALGQRVLRELRAEGVTVQAVLDNGAPTGLMVKERRTNDHTRVIYYRARSAGSRLCPEDVPASLVPAADVLHCSGITLGLSASAEQAIWATVDQATRAKVAISFDVNHRSAVWGPRDAGQVYRALAQKAVIVFAGLREARMITAEPGDAASQAKAISALGPAEVVIKLGPEGCVASVEGELYTVPAVPIDAVDTVGAGDAFVAGYLSERLRGAPAVQRLGAAVRAGAFACLSHGDWEGFPRRSELELLEAEEPVER
jgi:2-dehydro-3-deoxygluconokinase